MAFSALFFGEHIDPITWIFAAGVVVTLAIGRKTAVIAPKPVAATRV
jgi:hypothetical protein